MEYTIIPEESYESSEWTSPAYADLYDYDSLVKGSVYTSNQPGSSFFITNNHWYDGSNGVGGSNSRYVYIPSKAGSRSHLASYPLAYQAQPYYPWYTDPDELEFDSDESEYEEAFGDIRVKDSNQGYDITHADDRITQIQSQLEVIKKQQTAVEQYLYDYMLQAKEAVIKLGLRMKRRQLRGSLGQYDLYKYHNRLKLVANDCLQEQEYLKSRIQHLKEYEMVLEKELEDLHSQQRQLSLVAHEAQETKENPPTENKSRQPSITIQEPEEMENVPPPEESEEFGGTPIITMLDNSLYEPQARVSIVITEEEQAKLGEFADNLAEDELCDEVLVQDASVSISTVLDDNGETILHVSIADHMNDTDLEFGDYSIETQPPTQLFTTEHLREMKNCSASSSCSSLKKFSLKS